MRLLNQITNDGLKPRRKTHNEYSSACPACGGRDRFIIFVEDDRYWCRQCNCHGDAIQYLRDYHHLSFQEASSSVGRVDWEPSPQNMRLKEHSRKPSQEPLWREVSVKVSGYAHQSLLTDKSMLAWLKAERGISEESIECFNLGYFMDDLYLDRQSCGLEDNGKKLFIPKGLAIPWRDKRIRIRRENPGDYGRYYVLPGSNSEPYIIGTPHETLGVVVESELDAILLAQEADRELFIVALGSAQMKADENLKEKLLSCPVVLIALDNDSAGAKASSWWVENMPNAFRTLTPQRAGKDLSDAFLAGMGLSEWLDASLQIYCENLSSI